MAGAREFRATQKRHRDRYRCRHVNRVTAQVRSGIVLLKMRAKKGRNNGRADDEGCVWSLIHRTLRTADLVVRQAKDAMAKIFSPSHAISDALPSGYPAFLPASHARQD